MLEKGVASLHDGYVIDVPGGSDFGVKCKIVKVRRTYRNQPLCALVLPYRPRYDIARDTRNWRRGRSVISRHPCRRRSTNGAAGVAEVVDVRGRLAGGTGVVVPDHRWSALPFRSKSDFRSHLITSQCLDLVERRFWITRGTSSCSLVCG